MRAGVFEHPNPQRLDHPRQPRHQLGRLNAGYVGREHRTTRIRHLNALAELGRCEPAVVVFAEPQTVKTGEQFLRSRDLHVMPRRGHDAAAVVKIAVDALFGEDLTGARNQLGQLLPRGSRQGSAIVSKGIAAL